MENQDTHLLQNFPENEKIAYLSAIAIMAGSDGNVTEQEEAFLTALADRSDLSEQAEQQVMDAAHNPTAEMLQKHLDSLKTSQLRFSLITDLISFAHSDNSFTEQEQKQIKQIAAYLNITDQQYQALTQFVQAASKTNITEQDLAQPQGIADKTGMSGMLENAGISSGTLMKGALGILAPLILSRVLSGGGSMGRRGGGMMGGGGMGGGLGGMLGGLLGGMGGGGMGGYGRSGGGMMGGGGLGSLVSILGGLGGRGGLSQRGGVGGLGGLGGLLGGLMGGGKRSGW